MTTTLINAFPPNAFIVQSSNGAAYDLLSANVSTGVVTSAYLPASATNFLTIRLQKILTLLPSLSAAALKTQIKSLLSLNQLEGAFTSTVTATGSNYALGLSDLAAPSNMQVSIPFSMSSPFATSAGPPPTAESLGVTIGTSGSYETDGRMWGMRAKIDGSATTSYNFNTTTPGESGTISTPALDAAATFPRWWNKYLSAASGNAIAGLRMAGGDSICAWLTRPRISTLILIPTGESLTGKRIWVAMCTSSVDQISSSSAIKYAGLRFDSAVHATNWFLCSSDGANASEADTGIALVVGTEQFLDVDFSTAGVLNAAINGVAVTPKTNHLPVTSNAGYNIVLTSLDGTAQSLYWHHVLHSRL